MMVSLSQKRKSGKKPVIFTIGHSTHTIREFVDLLKAHGIEEVADIRTIPMSEYNPQFNKNRLANSLKKAGIEYEHLKKLGGLRHAKKDSLNLGWRNKSFRGFADYMATADFTKGLSELIKIASKKKTAMMCAEAVPWRCHRSLVADALLKKKWRVKDIMGKSEARDHKPTPFLRVRRGKLSYPRLDNEKKI